MRAWRCTHHFDNAQQEETFAEDVVVIQCVERFGTGCGYLTDLSSDGLVEFVLATGFYSFVKGNWSSTLFPGGELTLFEAFFHHVGRFCLLHSGYFVTFRHENVREFAVRFLREATVRGFACDGEE